MWVSILVLDYKEKKQFFVGLVMDQWGVFVVRFLLGKIMFFGWKDLFIMVVVKLLLLLFIIWWVDESDQMLFGYEGMYGEGFVDIDYLIVVEINVGLNIFCVLMIDIMFGWMDWDMDDICGFCDDLNVVMLIVKNYEGQFNIFLDRDLNKLDLLIYNDVMYLFKKFLCLGYFIQWIFKYLVQSLIVVDDDWVIVFKFFLGDLNVINDVSVFFQFQFMFYVQGQFLDGFVQVGSMGS